MASSTFSRLLKAEIRKYPSPAAPKPEPGVPTTLQVCNSLSKKSQLDKPWGVFTRCLRAGVGVPS